MGWIVCLFLLSYIFVCLLFASAIGVATVLIVVLVKRNKRRKKYEAGVYYLSTKQPYSSVCCNKGRYGEYMIYEHLKFLEKYGARFLFNAYLPKENGETTEIDVLMICQRGVFVFESKNFDGWIFGSEEQRLWVQTLPAGRGRSHKEMFYNPVMQNRTHIEYLKPFLSEQIPIHSIVVFSDRCKLKNVQIQSKDVCVIHHCQIASVVVDLCNQMPVDVLNKDSVAALYCQLYPFTQVDESIKVNHAAHIHNKPV